VILKHAKCAVIGCKKPQRSRGFCAADYQKYRMLKRTNRLPADWKAVGENAHGSVGLAVKNVVLPRGRAGAQALAAAKKAKHASRHPDLFKVPDPEMGAGKFDTSLVGLVKHPFGAPLPLLGSAASVAASYVPGPRPMGPSFRRGLLEGPEGVVAEVVHFSDDYEMFHWFKPVPVGSNTSLRWIDP